MEVKAWKYLITNPNDELILKMVNGSVGWNFFNVEPEPITVIDLLAELVSDLAKRHNKVLTHLQVKMWAERVWESDLLAAESRQILVDLADQYTRSMKDK